jgi:hypothetical protein
MAREEVKYCVEFRRPDTDRTYSPSFFGFKDREMAEKIAYGATENNMCARVVKQTRVVVTVYKSK